MGTLKHDLLAQGMELRETHISNVFMTETSVYKVKKPVQLGFLDFGSLEARKRYCEAELQLNRRLAPHVYRGVRAITRDAHGVHQLAAVGGGDIVEYAVEMQRLHDADAADARLRAGHLSQADLARIAERIAQFHAAARADQETAHFGECAVIEQNVSENFAQTRDTAPEFLSREGLAQIERWQRQFLQREHARFEARVRAGRIRDGHGDLRLEHCYLGSDGTVQIIDCIEFNDRFRYGDVCADVAFLAMDLSWHERPDLSESFLASYARASGDYDLYSVVDFYESYRAYVRGKVASLLAADASADEATRERARGTARKYYQLAEACSREALAQPRLYAVGGIIGSGKSTLATELADAIHAPVLEADRTRKELAGEDPHTPWRDQAFSGRYGPDQTRAVYAELLRRAAVIVRSGRSAVIDASFRERAQRQAAREQAAALGCEFVFVECVAPPDVCRQRLQQRAQGPSTSDGRADIFDEFVRSYEPVDELAPLQHVRIDTSAPAARVREQLRSLANPLTPRNDLSIHDEPPRVR
jgi:aminoglycoside phosphotransferase family enzyme/predicted kinase